MKKILGILLVGVLLLSPLMMVAKPAFALSLPATSSIDKSATVERGGDWATITATVQTDATVTNTYMRVKFTFVSMPKEWNAGFQAWNSVPVFVDRELFADPGGAYGWYPESNVKATVFVWVSKVQGKVNWLAIPGSYVYKMEVFKQDGPGTTTLTATRLAETVTGTLTITAGLPSMDWWALALLVMGLIGIGILTLRRNRTRTA